MTKKSYYFIFISISAIVGLFLLTVFMSQNDHQKQSTENNLGAPPRISKVEVLYAHENLIDGDHELSIKNSSIISINEQEIICIIKEGFSSRNGIKADLAGEKIRVYFNNFTINLLNPNINITFTIEDFKGFPYSFQNYYFEDNNGLIYGYFPLEDVSKFFSDIGTERFNKTEKALIECKNLSYNPVKVTFKTKQDSFQLLGGQEKIFKNGQYLYQIKLFKACVVKTITLDAPDKIINFSLERLK